MNYHSYRSSPIRNLDTSQAVRERFQDEFFQIRCTRLQKQKKQLQDQINLLNSKVIDNSHKTEEIYILNNKISHLIQQNDVLNRTIDQFKLIGSSSRQLQTNEILYQSQYRLQLQHKKEVEDLLQLYETAKAQTLIFRKQNQRLINLYQLERSRVSEVDDLNKAMEISKLKINLSEVEDHNKELIQQINDQKIQIERLDKLYNYQKRVSEQKQQEYEILLSKKDQQKEQVKYFSLQDEQTPIKNMKSDYEYSNKELEQLGQLRRKLQEQNEVYQAAIGKYTQLIHEHQEVVKQRDQLRAAGEFTLRQAPTQTQNIIEKSRASETKKQRLASNQVQRLKRQLKDKQQQIKSILTRFVPLTKIQEGEVSLQEDRKQRIQKHWKADLAILDVLLVKYKIQIY